MKPIHILLLAIPSTCLAAEKWFSGPQEIESTAEAISSGDILAEAYRLAYSGQEGPWKLDVGLGWNRYSIEYEPVLFGNNESLTEETWQTDVSLTHAWDKSWSGTLSLNAYNGFSDYRSIYTSQFYRQFFGAFTGYENPEPHGIALQASALWNYLPGSGLAELSLGAGRDVIAPGWSFNPAIGQPEPDRDTLETLTASMRAEQALNPWLKSELALTARQTSDRDPRLGIRNSWAAAAGPVAFRITGGYSEESPAFDAIYGAALVEWNFLPSWSLTAGYRLYHDSGEIETSGFNAQSPALDSTEINAGLLWNRGDLALSGSIGFIDTDYSALSPDNLFFENLYRDRQWWSFRLAASYRF